MSLHAGLFCIELESVWREMGDADQSRVKVFIKFFEKSCHMKENLNENVCFCSITGTSCERQTELKLMFDVPSVCHTSIHFA